jgi:nascent polypeptide-associated complex subunit alpha
VRFDDTNYIIHSWDALKLEPRGHTTMKMDNRQARRMMEKMGINQKEIPDVEEVVIRTPTKDIHVKNGSVSEVNFQGNRIFQVMGEVEEVQRETKTFSEEDVVLVQQQASVTRERAVAALEEADGEVARAILKLTS